MNSQILVTDAVAVDVFDAYCACGQAVGLHGCLVGDTDGAVWLGSFWATLDGEQVQCEDCHK